ncbi:MAG: MBOAT family protein [Clostridia bacterium]|nr:MBOAT family protein [Clostridia bacterium]
MLFNSVSFGIFLPIVFVIYWAIPHKYRWFLLLVSSYFFYMCWGAKYIVLILLTTVVSYLAGILLEKEYNHKKKKMILTGTMIVCLGTLFVFKYLNFTCSSIVKLLNFISLDIHPFTLEIVLPVGISFYTFQTMSYVIDVYRGEIKAEHHFGIYAAFISYFPQLVAGPIERTRNLLPQIHSEKFFDYKQATYGMKLMAWGFFKKLVIADVIAVYVDSVFGALPKHRGCDLLIAIFFFTIQIYCDFSGYSDIAIGTAKLMGIELMTNFKSPYFSTSIREFWSRWHISLSTWFKDYVYIPLGGNRCSKIRNYFNLMVTFLVSGLWHGASWNFLIWGGIHGIAQVAEKHFNKTSVRLHQNTVMRIFSMVSVFLFCNFAWIFFRAETFSNAIYVITHMFTDVFETAILLKSSLGLTLSKLLTIFGCITLLGIYDYFSLKFDVIERISQKSILIRYFFYFGIVFIILTFRASSEAEFVYFQF